MKAKCACGFVMEVAAERVGGTVRCPQCRRLCRIPAPEAPGEKAEEIEFGEEFELEEPGAPGPPGEEKPKAETPPRGLEFEAEEFELEAPEEPPEEEVVDLRPDQILAVETPEEVPRRAERVRAGPTRGEEEVPRTIFGLIWMCIRRPSLVAEIGIGGIADPSLVIQILAAFILLLIVPTVLETSAKISRLKAQAALYERMRERAEGGEPEGQEGFGEQLAIEEAGINVARIAGSVFAMKVGSWFIVAFSLYVIASMLGSGAGFFGILTGLAFVRVMAAVLLLGWGALAGIAGLLSLPGILPGAVALAVLGFSALAFLVLAFIFQIFFLMGVFDVGCFGALCLNFLATLMAAGLEMWLAAVIMGGGRRVGM